MPKRIIPLSDVKSGRLVRGHRHLLYIGQESIRKGDPDDGRSVDLSDEKNKDVRDDK
jgi:hypothetical protein